jgi:acyl-CoA synthetase (AMP-forming)/AMP-acid ligase II
MRRGAREIVAVGQPVPGMEVDVRDGRIWVRGVSVMTEYFGDPEATARVLCDGWLDTGDLGFIRDGELYISGRVKDVVIVRGANHAAQEFEECLDGIDGLRAGCAVALGFVPPGGEGEELLILAEQSGRADTEAIRAALLEHTGVRAHTVELLEPGTLPRTSSGKLRRAEALRRYLAGELAPPRRMGPLALARELVRSAWAYARLPEEQGV